MYLIHLHSINWVSPLNLFTSEQFLRSNTRQHWFHCSTHDVMFFYVFREWSIKINLTRDGLTSKLCFFGIRLSNRSRCRLSSIANNQAKIRSTHLPSALAPLILICLFFNDSLWKLLWVNSFSFTLCTAIAPV